MLSLLPVFGSGDFTSRGQLQRWGGKLKIALDTGPVAGVIGEPEEREEIVLCGTSAGTVDGEGIA